MRRVSVGDFRIGDGERVAIMNVLDSGRISEGEKVREFEKEFAKFIGTKYAIAVSSGSSALLGGLSALIHRSEINIKQNTNVITAPLTYIATSSMIVKAGLNPVYVDVDSTSFCITPGNIKSHLETVDDIEGYSLVLPVHLMGSACNGISKIRN